MGFTDSVVMFVCVFVWLGYGVYGCVDFVCVFLCPSRRVCRFGCCESVCSTCWYVHGCVGCVPRVCVRCVGSVLSHGRPPLSGLCGCYSYSVSFRLLGFVKRS